MHAGGRFFSSPQACLRVRQLLGDARVPSDTQFMKSRILIDAIVRQTTVLIARLSTVEGARSPLGHIANEVFQGLVTELESQGVGKKVIADMFGLALRSYRQKVQRLSESETSRGVTLWSAVQAYLSSTESATRSEVLDHFKNDEELSVRGVLHDLVESGFVIRSGRGDQTSYRAATEEELRDVGANLEEPTVESLAALAWVVIFREGPISLERVTQLVPAEADDLEQELAVLVADGRVSRQQRGDGEVFVAEEVLIPVGESAGWEAAIVDHHRTVSNAIAAKLTSGSRGSTSRDEVGGTTLTFDLWPGHPKEAEVRRLLADARARSLPLWEEVKEHNKTHSSADAYQVHFYFGQYLVEEEKLS